MNRERKRTCDLEAFKAAFSDPGRLAITGTALKSAAAMDLEDRMCTMSLCGWPALREIHRRHRYGIPAAVI
jgi:hypothetical protein